MCQRKAPLKREKRLILVALAFALLVAAAYTTFFAEFSRYSHFAKMKLSLARRSIGQFFELTGRFPSSLEELKQYAVAGKVDLAGLPYDPFTQRSVNRTEHRVLDGTGGLYYDPETGTLKINLTEPLRSYTRWCRGNHGDEVPAEW